MDSRHHPSFVKKTANCYFVVDYVNGLLDDINLPSLINKKEIMDTFPHDSEFCTPSLSFKYSKTTRSRITNYKKAVQEDVTSTRCNCANYPPEYVDNHHQHVFTGDIKTGSRQCELQKCLNLVKGGGGGGVTLFKNV